MGDEADLGAQTAFNRNSQRCPNLCPLVVQECTSTHLSQLPCALENSSLPARVETGLPEYLMDREELGELQGSRHSATRASPATTCQIGPSTDPNCTV